MGYLSDFLTGGTASAVSVNGTQTAAKAFDNDTATFWQSDASGTYPKWLKYDLGSGVTKIAAQYTIHASNIVGHPVSWTFEGSNDDSAWTTLDTQTGQEWSSKTTQTYNSFTNTNGYRYYKLAINSIHSGNNATVYEMEAMESDTPPPGDNARVTQERVEALLTDTAQSAVVTQERVVGLLTDTAQSAVVTQVRVQALIRLPQTPVLDVPCLAIYWDSGTEYYSDRDARHPDRIYQGRVMSWSALDREAEPHSLPRHGDVSIRIANADGALTTQLGTESPLRRRATIHVGLEGGSWASDYKQVFEGVVSGCSIQGDGTVEFRLMERVSERLADTLPNQIDPDDWPDYPEAGTAEYAPVVYGSVSGVVCPYVDDAGFRYVVACHPCASVTAVYLDGSVQQPEPIGHYHVETEVVGGVTYTLIDWDSDVSDKLVTADVQGVADVGGAVLSNPVTILADYCGRFLGVSLATEADWIAAAESAEGRGWVAQLLISDGATHDEVIGRLCREYGLDLYQTWLGGLRIGMWDSARARVEAETGPTLDAHVYTLAESSAWEMPRKMISAVQYRYGYNPDTDEWTGSGLYEDARTLAALGGAGYERREKVDLRYVSDADTAADLIRRRQFWEGRRANSYTLKVPAEQVLGVVDIGDLVRVSGLWKPPVDSATTELCRIVGMSLDLVARTVRVRCMGTGFAAGRILGDRSDPLAAWALLQEDERWNVWHLADRTTGLFSDGDAAHNFRFQ